MASMADKNLRTYSDLMSTSALICARRGLSQSGHRAGRVSFMIESAGLDSAFGVILAAS